jgi:phosphate uptake regulator
MAKTPEKEIEMEPDALERMDRALREAMKTPPKPHKDEPKRRKKRTYTSKAKRDG